MNIILKGLYCIRRFIILACTQPEFGFAAFKHHFYFLENSFLLQIVFISSKLLRKHVKCGGFYTIAPKQTPRVLAILGQALYAIIYRLGAT